MLSAHRHRSTRGASAHFSIAHAAAARTYVAADEGYPAFSVTNLSLGQRVYEPSRDEEFESRIPRWRLKDAGWILFRVCLPSVVTDNLRGDSRRCVSICTLPTAHDPPRTKVVCGFARIFDCGSERACYFSLAWVAREFSMEVGANLSLKR